jgi:hypothetical protein
MTAIVLSALFITCGFLAMAAIAITWHRYGRQTLALRDQVIGCSEWREVAVRITEVTVLHDATVLRPDFKRLAGRPSRLPALPAAA